MRRTIENVVKTAVVRLPKSKRKAEGSDGEVVHQDPFPLLLVQKKNKPTLTPAQEKQVKELAHLLGKSQSGLGQVLRILLGRIRRPTAPHTNEELEILMLVSLAEQRAETEDKGN